MKDSDSSKQEADHHAKNLPRTAWLMTIVQAKNTTVGNIATYSRRGSDLEPSITAEKDYYTHESLITQNCHWKNLLRPTASKIAVTHHHQLLLQETAWPTSLYPLPETPIPLNSPSPLPNIPQNSSRTGASAVLLFHTDQHNRVHNSEEVPRSFTMPPWVVVARLEGKQRCSRAPVASRTPSPRMHKVTVHKKQQVNEEQPNPAAAHHISTTAHQSDNTRLSALVPSRSTQWPAQAAGHGGESPKRGYVFAIFARVSCIVDRRRLYLVCSAQQSLEVD